MTRAAVALAVGLGLVAIALGVTLSGSPLVVAAASSTGRETLAETNKDAGACQANEVLPAGTSAIRFSLKSDVGPRVSISALTGTHVLINGVTSAGWTSEAVTVSVRPMARATSHVRICFNLGSTNEPVAINGVRTGRAVAAIASNGEALPGRVGIEYMRPARSSWWSTAQAVARRIGLGRAPSGTWIVLLLLALMGVIIATASWLTLKELR